MGRCVNRLHIVPISCIFDDRCRSAVDFELSVLSFDRPFRRTPEGNIIQTEFPERVSRLQRVSARKVRFPRRARANRSTHIT